MNEAQDRADRLAKRLGEPPTHEVAEALTSKPVKQRQTEKQRSEERLVEEIGRARSPQQGTKD